MKTKRFDKIVTYLQEKGTVVTGDGAAICFDEHYRENGQLHSRHVAGKITRLTLEVDEKNDCTAVTLDMDDTRNDFLIQKCKGNLTITERFVATLGQDPETGLWDEDVVELDINAEDSVLDALLDAAEHILSNGKTD